MLAGLSDIAALVTPLLAHAGHLKGDFTDSGVAVFAWLTLLTPLAGSLAIALAYRRISDRAAGICGTLAIFMSFGAAVGMLIVLLVLPAESQHVTTGYRYADVLGLNFDFRLYIDPLAVFMCLIVSGVSALIHLYSIPYMRSDAGYRRFFAYLNFFVFSMLLLVTAGNLALLIVGWALVGATSYLLISFWYRRETAKAAGIKAFVINVVGDVGLVLGAFLLWNELNTLDIPTLLSHAEDPFSVQPSASLTAAMLLITVGAFAKSAQLPLHTWLPDAMEGPTPVSALIHAATMVTAGVYLIARFAPFYEVATDAALVAAIGGCATLVIAATIALVQTDLKRVIAYSTMSQIGYMIMAVAAGAYSAGMFHLMTHAFFKALLFMCAGSVIAAMAGNQDITKMGGLRKAMPFTYITFVAGALTLAGFPLLSGFFSKDEILSYLTDRGGVYGWLAVFGLIGAVLTAFYALRLVLRVFHGDECPEAAELREGHLHHADPVNPVTGEPEDVDVGFPGPEHHIAEREWPMKLAMGVLAFLSVVAGGMQLPGVTDAVEHFLDPTFEWSALYAALPTTAEEYTGLGIGAVLSLFGMLFAIYAYRVRPGLTERIMNRLRPVYVVLWNKYYFDEAIDMAIVRPARALGNFCANVFEPRVIDGWFVGKTSGLARGGAQFVHQFQNGLVRAYAALVLFGVIGVSVYFYVVAR